MTIQSWLDAATATLQNAGITSARLDAELILAHVLGVERTWLIAHSEDSDMLSEDYAFPASASQDKNNPWAARASEKSKLLAELIEKRAQRVPLAYLTGTKEFYGRTFAVNEHTLIPRPETEVMIEELKKILDDGRWTLEVKQKRSPTIVDVGCGSGCIAITAKLEFPYADVTGVDISQHALSVARKNAQALDANVTFYESDLLTNLQHPASSVDFILANLPYVDRDWERSPETEHEPALALFADDGGLAMVKTLIEQADSALKPQGYLMLEADPEQHDEIIKTGAAHGLQPITRDDYIVVMRKS